jgi:hypothetical protein
MQLFLIETLAKPVTIYVTTLKEFLAPEQTLWSWIAVRHPNWPAIDQQ